MCFFKKLTIVSLNVAVLVAAITSAEEYRCDDGRDDTLSSGSYNGMNIEDGCYVNVNNGVDLSGTIQIRDGSRLTIVNATLSNVIVDANYGSYVSITSSSDQSEISARCQDGSRVVFNSDNICNRRRRRTTRPYYCEKDEDKTLSSGTYTALFVEKECDLKVKDKVKLSGKVYVEGKSKLKIDDATLSNIDLYVEDESSVSITSSGDESQIASVKCKHKSTATFNGESIC
eukprot:Awhi_evm1s2093